MHPPTAPWANTAGAGSIATPCIGQREKFFINFPSPAPSGRSQQLASELCLTGGSGEGSLPVLRLLPGLPTLGRNGVSTSFVVPDARFKRQRTAPRAAAAAGQPGWAERADAPPLPPRRPAPLGFPSRGPSRRDGDWRARRAAANGRGGTRMSPSRARGGGAH